MKPTVSYVRGLRDVLELNKEQRREYITYQEKIKERDSASKLMLSLIGASASALGLYFLFNGHRTSAITLIGLTYGGWAYRAYLKLKRSPKKLKRSRENLEKAGRAFQENIRNNTPIPKGLEREAFD